AEGDRRDAAALAAVGDPVGGDLQRGDHPVPDPDRAEGRALPPGRGRRALAPQPADLGAGRGAGAVRRHQAAGLLPRAVSGVTINDDWITNHERSLASESLAGRLDAAALLGRVPAGGVRRRLGGVPREGYW